MMGEIKNMADTINTLATNLFVFTLSALLLLFFSQLQINTRFQR